MRPMQVMYSAAASTFSRLGPCDELARPLSAVLQTPSSLLARCPIQTHSNSSPAVTLGDTTPGCAPFPKSQQQSAELSCLLCT